MTMQKVDVTMPLLPGCPEVLSDAGIAFEIAPDGLFASDAVQAKTIIDGYAGSAAQLAYHKREAVLAAGIQYETRINGWPYLQRLGRARPFPTQLSN
jgi:hypothetical protein